MFLSNNKNSLTHKINFFDITFLIDKKSDVFFKMFWILKFTQSVQRNLDHFSERIQKLTRKEFLYISNSDFSN